MPSEKMVLSERKTRTPAWAPSAQKKRPPDRKKKASNIDKGSAKSRNNKAPACAYTTYPEVLRGEGIKGGKVTSGTSGQGAIHRAEMIEEGRSRKKAEKKN